jgi:cold shock CspA family protein
VKSKHRIASDQGRYANRNLMDQQGRLTQWNDAKGYGFITPLSTGPRVFVHISQFQQRNRRPCLNELLTYVIDHDEQGRLRAMEVRYQNRKQLQPVSKKRSFAALPITAAVLVLLGLASVYFRIFAVGPNQSLSTSPSAADKAISNAYQAQHNGVQVGGEGVVERVLSDDDDGSRHQRFILRLASGQTLLIAHNIDIAPRIQALRIGDRVAFYGQYEWNEEGGVIHWTHHDPNGQHVSGWLKYNGTVYQ